MSFAGELGRCDLVEERLELVVSVLVEQGDTDALDSGEPLRACNPGEPSPDDCDVRRAVLAHRLAAAEADSLAPSRSRRWSPTRSAFAIAVSAGFTAPMLGKKLVSTT